MGDNFGADGALLVLTDPCTTKAGARAHDFLLMLMMETGFVMQISHYPLTRRPLNSYFMFLLYIS